MTTTSKFAALAAVAVLALSATAAMAYPAGNPCPARAQCAVDAAAYVTSQNATLTQMLTLKSNQQRAWKTYADARLDAAQQRDAFRTKAQKSPCTDAQMRLERRAERAAMNASLFKNLAQKRADLLKVLEPQQKLVLESYEMRGFAGGHQRGMRAGNGMGYGPQMGQGRGNGMGQGMGRGMGRGMGPAVNPNCPLNAPAPAAK